MEQGLKKAIQIVKDIEKGSNSLAQLITSVIIDQLESELDSIPKNDTYFQSTKLSNGKLAITILKTDSIYKDIPLDNSLIIVDFGLDLAVTWKAKNYIEKTYTFDSKKDEELFYLNIAKTLWEEYANLIL